MIIRKIEEKDINDVYEIIHRNFDGIMSEYHSKLSQRGHSLISVLMKYQSIQYQIFI